MYFRYAATCPTCRFHVPLRRLEEGPFLPEIKAYLPLPRQNPGRGHLRTYVIPVPLTEKSEHVYAPLYDQAAAVAVRTISLLWPYVPWLRESFDADVSAGVSVDTDLEVTDRIPATITRSSSLSTDVEVPTWLKQRANLRLPATVSRHSAPTVGNRDSRNGSTAPNAERIERLETVPIPTTLTMDADLTGE